MRNKRKKILILCPYPHDEAPSQRFRFEQYIPFMKEEFEVVQKPFLDKKTWKVLYKPAYKWIKIVGVLKGFLKRIFLLFTVSRYDVVLIHREATPIGYPFVEWVIAKVFRKKMIYDFDDAIWLPNTSQQNKLVAWLKYHQKVRKICRWSHAIFCGNSFLVDYAFQFNQNVKLVPTTIDTKYHQNHQEKQPNRPLVIGWTGTHSTEKYLNMIVPVLNRLSEKHDFIFRVISNHNPKLKVKGFDFERWKKSTEIEDLSTFDIGIMPLEDSQWAKGKCGFKGLQYMSLGIPTIMSPVGVNTELVQEGENGFLPKDSQEWERHLETLLEDTALRKKIGDAGKETVHEKYSVEAIRTKYVSYLLEVIKH